MVVESMTLSFMARNKFSSTSFKLVFVAQANMKRTISNGDRKIHASTDCKNLRRERS